MVTAQWRDGVVPKRRRATEAGFDIFGGVAKPNVAIGGGVLIYSMAFGGIPDLGPASSEEAAAATVTVAGD